MEGVFKSLRVFFVCCFLIKGGSLLSQEDIVVHVAFQKDLLGVILPPWIFEGEVKNNPSFEECFAFDFDHNGKTKVVAISSSSWKIEEEAARFKEKGAHFVIQGKLSSKGIEATLYHLYTKKMHTLGPLPLTGDPCEDRARVHLFSDEIYKLLFAEEGIASSKIIYTVKSKSSRGDEWESEVFESDYDGKGVKKLTVQGGYCITPTYIPPKPGFKTGCFLFVSYKTGQPKFFVGKRGSDLVQRLSLLPGNQLMPCFSKEGNWLAFVSDVTGNPDLFIQEFSLQEGLKGKPRQIFSFPKATQASPCFDPEGKRVAFVSNKDGLPRIYMLTLPKEGASLKGVKATLITKYPRESTAPSWSPDGKKIAYCAKVKGVRQIFIYDFETNEERQLTEGPGNKENPCFAKNSLHLVFNSSTPLGCELYLMNLNESKVVQISSGPGEKRFPRF